MHLDIRFRREREREREESKKQECLTPYKVRIDHTHEQSFLAL